MYNIIMNAPKFEWNDLKNRINSKKHGISFEEASSVFYDENAILFDDPRHSKTEERFLIIGISRKAHVCIVSHCYRKDDDVIRIISARRATKQEIKAYNSQGGLKL